MLSKTKTKLNKNNKIQEKSTKIQEKSRKVKEIIFSMTKSVTQTDRQTDIIFLIRPRVISRLLILIELLR